MISRSWLFLLVVLLPRAEVPTSSEEPTPGRVRERITCRAHPEQSYALYLPADYNSGKEWPLVLAFDPAARGLLPVERLKPASDVYGYILVGSNNSRNGPFEPSFRSAEAILNDVTERFSVDRRRLYLTGFSGGARLANLLGLLTEWVAGVVACGAGFPNDMEPRKIDFALVSVVGTRDMNQIETRQLHRTLTEKFHSTNRLMVFDDGHTWPPPEVLERAVGWLEIQAMRSGLRGRDPVLVDRLFRRELALADRYLEAGALPEAHGGYLDLLADYEGLVDLGEVRERLTSLVGRVAFKAALQHRKKLEKKEYSEIERYRRRLEEVFGENFKSTEWWASQSRRLDQLADRETDPGARDMWARVEDFLWRVPVERSWMAEDDRLALRFARIAAAVRPDTLYPQYSLARALAANARHQEALAALARAVELGLRRPEALTEEPAFERLRDENAFQQLLEKLRAASTH